MSADGKMADADYLRPVRPIGVDEQPEWNARSVFFMYPPTFGFGRRDGAASYRFMVKDESGVERTFTGHSPNDSLASLWGELPLSGWMDVRCEALDAQGGVIATVGERTFWKQAPFIEGAYPTAKRSPGETAKLIARHVMNQPIVQANYLSVCPLTCSCPQCRTAASPWGPGRRCSPPPGRPREGAGSRARPTAAPRPRAWTRSSAERSRRT